MFAVLFLELLILVSCQFCHSFSSLGLYFDINQGNSIDRVIPIIDNVSSKKIATLYFNLCQNIAQSCSINNLQSDGITNNFVDYQSYAVIVYNDSFCIPFTNISSVSTSSINGITISYQSPLINNNNYTLNLISPCTNQVTQSIDQSFFLINSGLNGCPQIDLTTIWQFFIKNQFTFFLITLILGIILMTLGIYLYRITLLLVGGIAAFFIFMLCESIIIFLPGVPNDLINSILIITSLTSLFIGYLTLYFPKAGLFGMGLWVGVILAFILNNIALYKIKSNPANLSLIIVMSILGVGIGILSLFIKKTFVIISTSFIGAYTSIRALSWYLGKFPNEFLIAKQYQQQLNIVQWQFYVYVAALFILTGSSMAIQFWLFRKKSKMMGKKANIEEYINKIEKQIDDQRGKYIQFQNVFDKKQIKPRYLKKKQIQQQEEEQQVEVPKKIKKRQQEEQEQEEQEQQEEDDQSQKSQGINKKKNEELKKISEKTYSNKSIPNSNNKDIKDIKDKKIIAVSKNNSKIQEDEQEQQDDQYDSQEQKKNQNKNKINKKIKSSDDENQKQLNQKLLNKNKKVIKKK